MIDHDDLVNMVAVGIDSKLAEKIVSKKYTLSKLRLANKRHLTRDFESWEVTSIIEATRRRAIPSETIKRLVKECDWKCCVCWDISKEEPVVIHHIKNSGTRDNSYDNLVLLCLNHHAIAHSKWQISRHPLPPELLRQRKDEWIKIVAASKRETDPRSNKKRKMLANGFNQSDKEALEHFRMFIDRPALHQPFQIEGNMIDFLTAITDIIRALNTGILKTREGDEICRTKPRSMLSNPNLRQELGIITSRFEELRTRFEIAVRDGEMTLQPNGFYVFHNREFPEEIDAMRESILLLFNKILHRAGLQPIANVKNIMRYRRFDGGF